MEAIEKARQRAGFTIRRAARLAGLTKNDIRRIEGGVIPPLEVRAILSGVYGHPPVLLWGVKDYHGRQCSVLEADAKHRPKLKRESDMYEGGHDR